MKSRVIWVVVMVSMFVVAACGSEADGEVDNNNEEEGQYTLNDNINETGFPIVNEPIELTFFVGLNPGVEGNLNEISSMKAYTELSNIHINWVETPSEALTERRNLTLVGEDLPDAFYGANLPTSDIFRYAQQGTFIELNELIENHAPNIKRILEEYPDIKSAITYPDGKIYSLPYLRDPEFISPQAFPLMYYNSELLEAVNMDPPETTEDFYQFLKAVKENDPDMIPYGGTAIGPLVGWLEGSFGIGNNRGAHIDKDPDTGDLRFIPTTDNYRDMLEFLNRLYSEGLIDERIYSLEWNNYLVDAEEGRFASTVFYDPETVIGPNAAEIFESAIPLEGPHGDQQLTLTTYVFNIGAFVITNVNEHPIETIKWVDHFYTDEGAKLRFMGVEGESYVETDDGYELTEAVTNHPDGLQTEIALRSYAHYLTPLPDPGLQMEAYFKGSETAPKALEAVARVEPYLNPENGWPQFTFTEEENRRLPGIETDILKYVEEMQAQFITGGKPFSEWDDYVSELERMNLDEYMDIQRAALERYENQQ